LRSDVGKARPGSGFLAAGTRGDLIPTVDLGVSDTLRSVDDDALDRIGGVWRLAGEVLFVDTARTRGTGSVGTVNREEGFVVVDLRLATDATDETEGDLWRLIAGALGVGRETVGTEAFASGFGSGCLALF
jgi:hypothetical protein